MCPAQGRGSGRRHFVRRCCLKLLRESLLESDPSLGLRVVCGLECERCFVECLSGDGVWDVGVVGEELRDQEALEYEYILEKKGLGDQVSGDFGSALSEMNMEGIEFLKEWTGVLVVQCVLVCRLCCVDARVEVCRMLQYEQFKVKKSTFDVTTANVFHVACVRKQREEIKWSQGKERGGPWWRANTGAWVVT